MADDPRSRSRSPPRHKSKSTHSSGFRWKEKRPRDEAQDGSERRLERGYRHDRDGYREREREHERRGRDDEPDRRHGDRDADDKRERRKKEKPDKKAAAAAEEEQQHTQQQQQQQSRSDAELEAPSAPLPEDDDIARKFGVSSASVLSKPSASTASSISKPAKPAKAPKVRVPTGPMIVVKVNDRLGTTSKIPCLPSDSVGDFKKLVAMQIGRKPHEIMLKRQSERPFKDFLTLEDYGISDGVQLDLELDTGD